MKKNKSLTIYVTLGNILCATAGAIVGFVVGGPFFILPGTVLGVISALFFKQSLLSNVF